METIITIKKGAATFLQVVIVALSIAALAIMIWLPLTEGRATNLDLLSIYSDPFIVYGYLASIVFFVALYQAFKLLGYIGQNKIISLNSVKALMTIKYCAAMLSILVVLAALYIRTFHAKDDDPAGFIAMCIVITFICIVIAITVAKFEKYLRNSLEVKK